MKPGEAWGLLRGAFAEWLADGAPRLGAALAYYTLFSLAPLLLAAIAVAGLAFGEEAAQGRIVAELESLIGRSGAEAAQAMIEASRRPSSGIVASLAALATLLVGASGVFVQLQDALNIIWKVRPKPGRAILRIVRERLLSFTVVLGTGFLLLVSLVLTAAVSALGGFLNAWLPFGDLLAKVLDIALSFGVITLLFAMIFKILPDVKLAWSDVWLGAAATAALFTLGKFVIGLYLGSGNVGSHSRS